MSTCGGWLRPTTTIGIPLNQQVKPKSSKQQQQLLRASFIEYPLASKILVRNLSYSTNERGLKEEFSNFGPIAEVKLIKDETSKKSRGYAFVQYTNQDDAMSALESMDEKYLDGRVIFVELAKPVKDKKSAYPKTSGPPFLAQKETQD